VILKEANWVEEDEEEAMTAQAEGNWVEEDNMASWRWPKNTLCTPYNETMIDLYSRFIKVLVTRLYVQYYIKRVYSSTT
jgi:hypothetical protein